MTVTSWRRLWGPRASEWARRGDRALAGLLGAATRWIRPDSSPPGGRRRQLQATTQPAELTYSLTWVTPAGMAFRLNISPPLNRASRLVGYGAQALKSGKTGASERANLHGPYQEQSLRLGRFNSMACSARPERLFQLVSPGQSWSPLLTTGTAFGLDHSQPVRYGTLTCGR